MIVMKPLQILKNGIFSENPTFRLILGMCPTLATTTSVENGVGMGLATMTALVASNATISAIRRFIPAQVRIPCYIVVIASLVTIIEMPMKAFLPTLYESLGIFIPLIVVNCIILARAEAFASRNSVFDSILDGLGMGLGFTLALALVSLVRQVIGGVALLSILPPGGFIVLGVLLAAINALNRYNARRQGRPEPGALRLDCRHCVVGCGRDVLDH